MTEVKFLEVTYRWRDRKGDFMAYTGRNITPADAEAAARNWGWPGHDGAWWRYVLDDLKSLFGRRGE